MPIVSVMPVNIFEKTRRFGTWKNFRVSLRDGSLMGQGERSRVSFIGEFDRGRGGV